MIDRNWERLKELLHQASQLSPESRVEFLDKLPDLTIGLREELDSLLAESDRVETTFMGPLVSGGLATAGGFGGSAALTDGQIFAARFRLIRKLGEGGMGQVWLAEQIEPVRRTVALKLIRAGMYDETVDKRFQSERQSLAMMDHPAIAKVFDAGTTPQGQPYFVMEYVSGLPITDYCDRHELTISARLDLFIQTCEGVQHAHQKAIIHRDLKPSNILVVEVDGKPVPRIIDFGLAKATVSETEPVDRTLLSRFGNFMGTPGYMSPEQVDPNIKGIDTRTDVYSLGVILYVLLTGLQPFESKRRQRPPLDEWLRRLREDEPPTPSTKVNAGRDTSGAAAAARRTEPKKLVSQLRGDLDWIALKALERDRDRRYATPLELAGDLHRYLTDEPVTARPQSASYQIRKFIRRHRFATAFVGMVTILSVATSAAALIAVEQAREARHQANEARTAQARMLTEAAAQRLKDQDVAGGHNIIVEVLTHSAFAQSRSPASINVFQELRASDPQLAVLSGHTGIVESAMYSPNGTRIVTASDDKTARIWDAHLGAQLAILAGHSGWIYSAAYSPDGTRIVTASDDKTARIWDAATGTELAVLSGHSNIVDFAAYSPDGTRIVTASYDKSARIWDARSGALLTVLSGHGDIVRCAAYSPDGARIVTASIDKTARIWDARTGAQLRTLTGHTGFIISAAYSPDGARIVTASIDKTARIWDARTGAPLAVLAGHAGSLESAAYSPDGTHIVTASYDKTATIWDASSGAELAILAGHGDIVQTAAYSPDGTRIVTASHDTTARVWDARTGSQLAVIGHTGVVSSAAYSPDSTRVVTTSEDKIARIWDARTLTEVALLTGHTGLLNSAVYSPDGAQIVTASTTDKTARVWDARAGTTLAVLAGHTSFVISATYSPDGGRIVTASNDKTARIWDARTGAVLAVLTGHNDRLNFAAYSPDGTRIVTASNDKTARIWDARTRAQLGVLAGHTGLVSTAVYSPDGAHVVTASYDKTARIWDARTGAQLAVLSGHRDSVEQAGYSPDGMYIVTASEDKTARIWDARTGAQLAVLPGHRDAVESAAYSPDGSHIITASDDGTARIWDAIIPATIAAQILWYAAAGTDSIPDDERTDLGLPPDFPVRQWTTQGSSCDRAAAAFYDPDRLARGLADGAIVADVANSACSPQTEPRGSTARTAYHSGRALLAKSDKKGARQQFELAATAGYRAAKVDLANLLLDASAGTLDIQRARILYEQAWDAGVPIAAFRLGRSYEQETQTDLITATPVVPPDPLNAWKWYAKGADAGEPNALSRFGEREEHDALAEPEPAKRNARLLEAFRRYAAAAERAHEEDWPDDAWKHWRHRRASLARILAKEGKMQEVADAYARILARSGQTDSSH